MAEKYDIKKMLKEIEEDESLENGPRNLKISQDDIKKLIEKRMNKKGNKA